MAEHSPQIIESEEKATKSRTRCKEPVTSKVSRVSAPGTKSNPSIPQRKFMNKNRGVGVCGCVMRGSEVGCLAGRAP